MSISRDTFDPAKNYKRVRYQQDRELLDSELNEQQAIALHEQKKVNDLLLRDGAIVSGLGVSVVGNVVTVAAGVVYIDGCLESIDQTILTYDPLKTSGIDYVYVELITYAVGVDIDPELVNDATGEPTAEREKWVVTLQDRDTSADALSDNALERKVVKVYAFDRSAGVVAPVLQRKSNLKHEDLSSSLPGSRIAVASVPEDRLALIAAEGQPSLLHNLATRLSDHAGSYVVCGLDTFVASVDGGNVQLITNPGKAYTEGRAVQTNLPTSLVAPLAGPTLGRKDIIYATAAGVNRLPGAPAAVPKLPVAPEGALVLAILDFPAGSTDVTLTNIAGANVTMEQLSQLMRDVEVLKRSSARVQMYNDLLTRDANVKKGVYTDDFSSGEQSDVSHADWSVRLDALRQVVTPDRAASSTLLVVDPVASNALFAGSLALLPAAEVVLFDQPDWSEEMAINSAGVFGQPEATVRVTPTIGRRGMTSVSVTGANFIPNSYAVAVLLDGQVVAPGLHADAVGRVTGEFTIPESTRTGSLVLEMTDGTNTAEAILQVNDPLAVTRIQRVEKIPELHIVRTAARPFVWRETVRPLVCAPLAQAFVHPETCVVSAVGIHFIKKDSVLPVTVQIRRLAGGLPGEVVLAEKVLAPTEIQLNVETKVVFDDPFRAEANISYAVVLLTNSSQYTVRVATLEQVGQQGIVTSLAHTDLLLESLDARTWMPREQSSLTMRLYGYEFQASGTVAFQPVTAVQFSDLNLDEYSSVPDGSSIAWEYSIDGGSTWRSLVPAEEEQLTAVATQVHVRARLSGTVPSESPVLNFPDVNLIGYLSNTSGTYVTRQIELLQAVASTKLYAQMNTPPGTSVTWYASNDGGATWEAMVLDSTRPIDAEWTEHTLSRVFANPAGTQIRYKAEMAGTTLVYPRIHSLGSTLH